MLTNNHTVTTAFSIVNGDCVQGMRGMEPQSVDVVVTSPPYNIGKDYGSYDDDKGDSEYMDWCEEWAAEIRRVLKPQGSFFLNLGNSSPNPFFAFEVAARMKAVFELQNTIHWF